MEYKLPIRKQISNKSTYGRVLNIAGSDYMPGAAFLSSVSALKIGCGYCFLCSTERVIDSVAAQTQNIVFCPIINLENELSNADVVEIGCGLSQSDCAIDIFKRTLLVYNPDKPIIIDADGINILSKNFELFSSKNFKKVILTPHPKEASRLLSCSIEEILADVSSSAIQISKIYNCVTVLKTHQTVITSSDGRIYKNFTGNSSLAKAGSGDVLTGMIAGLIAQGMDIFEGAALGVYLHGLCAEYATEKLTQYCVNAQDLISFIPTAVKYHLDN